MNSITLPTTLHCAGCIAAVKPVFDAAENVKQWKVDLTKPIKTITVTGQNVSRGYVTSLLQQAGYDVLVANTVVSAGLPAIGSVSSAPPNASTVLFWSDLPVWRRAGFNTLNCLLGCSIGDFGTILVLQAYYPNTPMLSQMILATISGLCTSVLLETTILKVREQFAWKEAFTTALSMSFISMITMEIAMNASDFMVTGGKASFNTPQYWVAFAIASVVGFIAPLPYNYFKLKKYNKSCH